MRRMVRARDSERRRRLVAGRLGALNVVPPAARASVVPIATVPPPTLPDALTRAVEASVTLPVAFTAT